MGDGHNGPLLAGRGLGVRARDRISLGLLENQFTGVNLIGLDVAWFIANKNKGHGNLMLAGRRTEGSNLRENSRKNVHIRMCRIYIGASIKVTYQF